MNHLVWFALIVSAYSLVVVAQDTKDVLQQTPPPNIESVSFIVLDVFIVIVSIAIALALGVIVWMYYVNRNSVGDTETVGTVATPKSLVAISNIISTPPAESIRTEQRITSGIALLLRVVVLIRTFLRTSYVLVGTLLHQHTLYSKRTCAQ